MDLTGKTVLITRPRAQAAEFGQALLTFGALPVYFPVIEITPPADTTNLDTALARLPTFDWVIFTSVNAVEIVWQRLSSLGVKYPATVSTAAIGPKTASALLQRGVELTWVPEEYIAEAIVPGLGDLKNRRVLLPRAELARKALSVAIRDAGGIAVEVTAYHTLPAQPDSVALDALRAGVDVLTFTSSSTVTNFVALTRRFGLDPAALPGKPVVACIGPVTAATAVEEGLRVDVSAAEYTTAGLVDALLALSPALPNP